MASFRALVKQLGDPDPKRVAEAHGLLIKASQRVVPHLVEGLKSPSADARETCAEMLSERKDPNVVPALISVLDDEVLFVRHDALWAIENLCGYRTAGLQDWLDVDFEKPRELKRKVQAWWQRNRRYIQGNWRLTW